MFQCGAGSVRITRNMRPQKGYNLKRYQKEVVNISTAGDFKPTVRIVLKQTHVTNKPWAICRFQKNVLENHHKWPKDTKFEIEEVE